MARGKGADFRGAMLDLWDEGQGTILPPSTPCETSFLKHGGRLLGSPGRTQLFSSNQLGHVHHTDFLSGQFALLLTLVSKS